MDQLEEDFNHDYDVDDINNNDYVSGDGVDGLGEDYNHDCDVDDSDKNVYDAGDGVDGPGEERSNPGEDRQGNCSEAEGGQRWKGDYPEWFLHRYMKLCTKWDISDKNLHINLAQREKFHFNAFAQAGKLTIASLNSDQRVKSAAQVNITISTIIILDLIII